MNMDRDNEKPVVFLGSSLKDLRAFPGEAVRDSGYQLGKVQVGEDPDDWKPMTTVGVGVREIRIAEEEGAFRVFYVVNRADAIYVLHAFRKTTEKTETRDIDLARDRLKSLG